MSSRPPFLRPAALSLCAAGQIALLAAMAPGVAHAQLAGPLIQSAGAQASPAPDVARECERFQPPEWFAAEVSGKSRYSNVRLARE